MQFLIVQMKKIGQEAADAEKKAAEATCTLAKCRPAPPSIGHLLLARYPQPSQLLHLPLRPRLPGPLAPTETPEAAL